MSTTDDDTPGRTRRVRRLGARINEARNLRGLVVDPDLQAVEMERQGRRTLAGLWFFLALGLVFTTEGVQRFLAGDSTPADPLWWAAWAVEPMFAGLLIVLLNFEAVILAHGIEPDHPWWQRLKHVLLASTLSMNVLPQLAPLVTGDWDAFNLGSLAVHAIIPVIVYGLAEVIPVIQARRRQVIRQAYAHAAEVEHQEQPDTSTTAPLPDPDPAPVAEVPPTPAPAPEPAPAASEAPAVPSAPAPAAPVPGPPPDSGFGGAKLPASTVQALRAAHDRATSEGREFTTADVRQVARLPEPLAARIAADLTGHATA
ncbi:hypothetical protein AB8O55_07075 [Saccharopolyspora cebuensis]|uniref:DUF2637 domain-containing protein n=1 Tax=Saccharopolyspora cebuensis TaxID=418759 RepID=A0ABV4CDI3_9PSEU